MSQSGPTPESSLLLTLEEISQLVSHSHDPGETLTNIVRLIQRRFHTDVCSVYLLEAVQQELVLGATVGLRPESVGRVRMRTTEGLTGLVAERLSPVMVDDEAFRHPRFKYFPELGEDAYHSFLGVPLVESGSLQGVLVVQTLEPRSFTASETRMLVAVAAQLAPLVSEARVLEQVTAAAARSGPAPQNGAGGFPSSLRGTALSPGVGFGVAYVVNGFDEWEQAAAAPADGEDRERERLHQAMDAARQDIARLSQRISRLVGEEHGAILQAQLMILQDRTIEQELHARLHSGGSAEAALLRTLHKYVAAFQEMKSAYFQERVYDVKDVFRRILWRLRPREGTGAPEGERLVLVSREASVTDLFSVDIESLAGVVVEHGGPQSHAAILARSLGVPMVSQMPEFFRHMTPGRRLLVNGSIGMIYVDPPAALVVAQQQTRPQAAVPGPAPAPTAEPAGGLPRVEANINLLVEVAAAVEQDVCGVGLYRTEFLFIARRTLPTEEEQVGIYRKLVTNLGGRPVNIRTFDLRPDKLAHAAHLTTLAGGPLDWRLVLESPPLQKLFKEQIRAILRAAAFGPARILVPLVTRTELLDLVLETVGQARQELTREGLEFGEDVPVGIMIEVAAATMMMEAWAEYVDFFAMGTNDLTASALGLDRDDPVGATRNDPLHPGLMRLLHHAVGVARRAGRRITVCGELAADPEGAVALAALQVDALSVPVNQLAAARRGLGLLVPDDLADVATRLLELRSAGEVRAYLRQIPRTVARA